MIEVGRITRDMLYRLPPMNDVDAKRLHDRLIDEVFKRFPEATEVSVDYFEATGRIVISVDNATGGALGAPDLLLTDASGDR